MLKRGNECILPLTLLFIFTTHVLPVHRLQCIVPVDTPVSQHSLLIMFWLSFPPLFVFKEIASASYAFSSIQNFDRLWMDLGGCTGEGWFSFSVICPTTWILFFCLFHKEIIKWDMLLCFLLLEGEQGRLNFSCQELRGRNSSFGPEAFGSET